MILKISPADVVSIPTDYDGAKGRCCKYEVVAQVNGDPKDAFAGIVNTEYNKPQSPAAAWPFGNSAEYMDGDEPEDSYGDSDIEFMEENEPEELYDVVRVYGNEVIALGVTYEEAEALVEKNKRQKKAMLKIVREGTDEEA